MRIGRVVGNLVSTVKDGALPPYKLLLVEYLNPMTMEPEGEREIATDLVGEQVMEKLREVDEVAYVRFASVYRQFKDIHTIMAELTKLLEEKPN